MHNRCTNLNHPHYNRYGGRGITICKRWFVYENFLADMGYKPAGLSLERIDNNGNYELNNCKWATKKEQVNNRSNNKLVTYLGRTQNLTQWCEELKLNYAVIKQRLYRGYTLEEAFKN